MRQHFIRDVGTLPFSMKGRDALKLYQKMTPVHYKLGRLEERVKQSLIHTNFINVLSLQESVQSTRIEESQVTFTDMIEASNSKHPKWEIIEVRNYQRALNDGFQMIQDGIPISSKLVRRLHKILFLDEARGTAGNVGEFRKIENFIGPTNKREDAVYIPIDAHRIDEYMSNWETFINGHPYAETIHPKVVEDDMFLIDDRSHDLLKVAVLHAQFESIHPFLDGNGRIGRILIALYMVQSNLMSSPIFFISEELERYRAKYYQLLNGVRGEQPKWYQWLDFFIEAADRMATKLLHQLERAEQIAEHGLSLCKNETEKKVYRLSFSYPNLTTKRVVNELNVSSSTARRALNELATYELLFKDESKQRNVEYLNYDVLSIVGS